MAEASFTIFGLAMVVVWASSLHVLEVRNRRKRRESSKIILHTKQNLAIGVILGVVLSTIASLDPIAYAFGINLPWIAVPFVLLSYTFVVSLVAVELVIFRIGFQIKKLPVDENMKSFLDGMISPMAALLLLDLFLRIDPSSVLKHCCA